jgi:hypothetical protein
VAHCNVARFEELTHTGHSQEYDEEDSGPSDHVHDIMHETGPGNNLATIQDLKAQALQQLPHRQRALQLIDTFAERYVSGPPCSDRLRLMNFLGMLANHHPPVNNHRYPIYSGI